MKTTLKEYQSAQAKSKMLMTLFSAVNFVFAFFFHIGGETYHAIYHLALACLLGVSSFFIYRECGHYEEMINIYKWRSNAEEAK